MNECCKRTAVEIFEAIEKEPRGLGLEKLAKEHPDFVSWITYNYQDWQKLKSKFLEVDSNV
jgi:hypothetical protein